MPEDNPAVWFEGKVSINPSTLYMSGERPATIMIRCTTDEARMIDGKRAMLMFDPEQFDDRDADHAIGWDGLCDACDGDPTAAQRDGPGGAE